jgi:hypothetical protein
MSTENYSDNYKTKSFSKDTVMPCLVYYTDSSNFEKIGVAEHFIDSKYVMVRYNSYCRDLIPYYDLRLSTLLTKNNDVFLIEKGWIDPSENHNNNGYKPFGYKSTEQEAKDFCESQGYWTPNDISSIKFYKEQKMPKYRYRKIELIK